MSGIDQLIQQNRDWSEKVLAQQPDFFSRLANLQTPEYLWIGCSDSRVPANQITGLAPGEVFVHRNVANLVIHTDLNCLSVVQYAVEFLKVKHIIVCGHYGCGGVIAAHNHAKLGLIDNWLRHLQDIKDRYSTYLQSLPDTPQKIAKLCELNVIEQVKNLISTTVIQDAWEKGQTLEVHGLVYDVHDGLLKDLKVSMKAQSEVAEAYHRALRQLSLEV